MQPQGTKDDGAHGIPGHFIDMPSCRRLTGLKRSEKEEAALLADAAHEVPALLLDALDVAHRLHARDILHGDLRDPLHARGMAPQVVVFSRLQSAPRDGAQAALRGDLVLLLQHPAGGPYGKHDVRNATCRSLQELTGSTAGAPCPAPAASSRGDRMVSMT